MQQVHNSTQKLQYLVCCILRYMKIGITGTQSNTAQLFTQYQLYHT